MANTDRAPLDVAAHDTTIRCIALNLLGTKLATASERGTLIRVFDTTTGTKLTELRRGTNPATIYCINFDHDSSKLVVSSDHGTIHIFNLGEDRAREVSSLTLIPDYFKSQWSFCKFTIPKGPPCICAFSSDQHSVIGR